MHARILAASLLVASACSKAADAPVRAEAQAEAAWPDARSRDLPSASVEGGKTYALALRYEPGAQPAMRLELDGKAIWSGQVTPPQRDALWNAVYWVAAEPAPGNRLALSDDGGATFRPIFQLGDGPLLCAHGKVPSVDKKPDWAKLPGVGAWATGVLETAVWGCEEPGKSCKSQSLNNGVVHHSEAAADALAQPRSQEIRRALAAALTLPVDRPLAFALVDAAVGYQGELSEGELKELGRLAAKAISEGGPLSPEERKAMALRISLARAELKELPKDQLSPRVSLEALTEAAQGVPAQPVSAGK